MEESQPAPRSFPPSRAHVSGNWRQKDETARTDTQASPRNQRNFNQNRNTDSHGSQDSVPETRLYVGNLLYTATRQDVEALFVNHGFQITGISMSIDPFTNRNRSYAFVDFETVDEAQRAMADLNGQELLGRAVKINPGMRKEGGSTGIPNRSQNYEGQRGGSERTGGRMNSQEYVSNGYAQTQQSPRPENPLRLYVGNLPNIEPQESLENELKALFTGFQIQKVSRLVAPHESKTGEPGNHYYCFLDFATTEEADQAMEAFNGKESPWGAELRINKARDNRTRRQYGGGRDSHTRTNGEGIATAGGAWR